MGRRSILIDRHEANAVIGLAMSGAPIPEELITEALIVFNESVENDFRILVDLDSFAQSLRDSRLL